MNDFLKGQKSVFSGTLAPIKHHNILDNFDTNDGSNCANDALPPELKKLRNSVRLPCYVMKRKGSIVEVGGRICSYAQEFNCDWPLHHLTS